MSEIDLTRNEMSMLVAALATVCPTGGGGATHQLFLKLALRFDIDTQSEGHHSRVTAYSNNVVREWVEDANLSDKVTEVRGGPIVLVPQITSVINAMYGEF